MSWTVSVHTSSSPKVGTARIPPVSLSLFKEPFFGFGFSNLVWKSTLEEKGETVDCRSRKPSFQDPERQQVSPNRHLAYTTACTPKVLFRVQPQKKEASWHRLPKFACFPTSSPCCLPASDSTFPQYLAQRRRVRRGQTSLNACTCFVLSLGTYAGEKETPMALHLLSEKSLAFHGFKDLVMEESTCS